MEKCDALVVGAGVSGSVAALKAAKEGLDTVVIEKKKMPGEPNTKLDITRDVGIMKIVDELSLKIEDQSNVSRWFSSKDSFTLTSKIGDLFVKRGNSEGCFEVSTLDKAKNAGAETIMGTRITKTKNKGTHITEVTLDNGLVLMPDSIIVASGQEPDTLQALGINLEEKEPIHFAAYGEMSTKIDIPEKITHVFLDSEIMPQGYFYMGRTSNGLCTSVMVVSSNGTTDARESYDKFVSQNEFVRRALSKREHKSSLSGSRYAADIKSRVHGNVFLVGDSGRFMDPLLGYGLNQSIYTGYWAASSVSAQDANIFNEKTKRVLGEIKRGKRARRVFASLKNNDFDLLIGALNGMSAEMDMDNFLDNPGRYPLQIAKMILKKPELIGMIKHLVWLL